MTDTGTLQAPDIGALRARQQATWASGDYARIGVTLQIVGEQLCESLDLTPGSRVLDIAAGNGNATLAAARRFCDVTSSDYVPALLAGGRARASAEGQSVRFIEAAAEDLPFADGSFDVAISTFGVMFSADHEAAAREALRVVREGGLIGLANWTPEGFIGQLLRTVTRRVPPPPAAKSPLRWGTPTGLREIFGPGAEIQTTTRFFTFRYRSPEHFVEMFRLWYGPVLKAFAALPESERPAFERELLELVSTWNRAKDGTVAVPSEYLEVVLTKG